MIWFIPISILTWVIYAIIQVPLFIIGLFVIPLALLGDAHRFEKSRVFDDKTHKIVRWTWWWMWPWGNEEDGVIGSSNYFKEKTAKGWPEFLIGFVWSALRNPTNNLRFTKYISVKIDPERVRYRGSLGPTHPDAYHDKKPMWFYARCGIYSGFYWQFMMLGTWLWRFWIGWKILPSDTIEVEEYRRPGAGFAYQFKKVQLGNRN